MQLRQYLIYITIYSLSTISSFAIVYGGNENFENSFVQISLSKYQLFLLICIFSTLIYFLVAYLLDKYSMLNIFFSTYFMSLITGITLLWIFKLINLSRLFLFYQLVLFIISILVVIRFFNDQKDGIYITFQKLNLFDSNYEALFVDLEDAETILNTISTLVREKNINGILVDIASVHNNNLNKIIEISNYLGLDILTHHNFKTYHKSTSINRVVKHFEDIVLIIFLTPFFLATFIVVSLVILFIDGKPIIFTQKRVGANGAYFQIYKFKTMKDEQLSIEQIKDLNEKDRIVFKSSNDPRITSLGKLLRKLSLDEVPQIFNVIKNEMSFVGPRPPIVDEVKKYELKHLKRISVKPGITGLWQVTLRQDNTFDKWVEKDIEYIENWSIFQDIKILYKTVFEIFKMTGT